MDTVDIARYFKELDEIMTAAVNKINLQFEVEFIISNINLTSGNNPQVTSSKSFLCLFK